MRLFPTLFILAVGCTASDSDPLGGPSLSALKKLPGVAAVGGRSPVANPPRKVIHILDYRWIRKDEYALAFRNHTGSLMTDEEFDREYDAFRDRVEAVQAEQMKLLRALIQDYGIRQVFLEGITDKTLWQYNRGIELLQKFEKNKPAGETILDRYMLEEHRDKLLRYGAAGRLMMEGCLDEVLPADDSKRLARLYPVVRNQRLIDYSMMEKRENALVEKLKSGPPVAVLILSGAHDLTNNVPSDWEYLRVETEQFLEALYPKMPQNRN